MNKTFLRFTLGFICILIMSFALAVIVARLDKSEQTASTVQAEP